MNNQEEVEKLLEGDNSQNAKKVKEIVRATERRSKDFLVLTRERAS